MWKCKITRKIKAVLKRKSQFRRLLIPDFKIDKVRAIKAVCYYSKDRHKDKWKRRGENKRGRERDGEGGIVHLIFKNGINNIIQWEKNSFVLMVNGAGTIGYP